MEPARDGNKTHTSRDAEVIVVGVRDQDRVQAGDVGNRAGNSISKGMSKPPRTGSTMTTVPRELMRKPAIPSQYSTVPSFERSNASLRKEWVRGAMA